MSLKIYIADKSTMGAIGKGTIKFEAFVDGKRISCYMENVLYVPAVRRHFSSVTSVLDKGMSFHLFKTGCEFLENNTVKAR